MCHRSVCESSTGLRRDTSGLCTRSSRTYKGPSLLCEASICAENGYPEEEIVLILLSAAAPGFNPVIFSDEDVLCALWRFLDCIFDRLRSLTVPLGPIYTDFHVMNL